MRGAITLCSLAVFLFSVALFGAVDKYSVTISEPVTVEGTSLQPGDYTVKYDDAQKTAAFVREGKEVATVHAEEQPMTEKVSHTEELYDHGRLQEIRRKDKKLVFNTASPQMQPSGAVGNTPPPTP